MGHHHRKHKSNPQGDYNSTNNMNDNSNYNYSNDSSNSNGNSNSNNNGNDNNNNFDFMSMLGNMNLGNVDLSKVDMEKVKSIMNSFGAGAANGANNGNGANTSNQQRGMYDPRINLINSLKEFMPSKRARTMDNISKFLQISQLLNGRNFSQK